MRIGEAMGHREYSQQRAAGRFSATRRHGDMEARREIKGLTLNAQNDSYDFNDYNDLPFTVHCLRPTPGFWLLDSLIVDCRFEIAQDRVRQNRRWKLKLSSYFIEAPCPALAGLKRGRESPKCKETIPFYCTSLANPAASYGECARCRIFN